MRLFIFALAVSAAAAAGVIGGSAEFNPVRTHPHTQEQSSVHQIIVKLRSATASSAAASGRAHVLSAHDRVANVAGRTGLTVRESRPITDRLHVMLVEPAAAGDSIAATVERLRADADVEYAEPDQRRYPHALPDDTLYPEVSPLNSGQWYLQNDPATPSAVNAAAAWDITKGDPNLVIADLDTGVLFDHPDLLTAAANGRLLPGYDFVSNVNVANDGDGRDANASDPGDWINSTDTSTDQFKTCKIDISSWHGTRTAGILGALTNNARGVAGMTWAGRILPVRVLGKCGGFDSDIIAGMLWAAGITVSGVPDNAHPARIINMSLGATGTCPQSYSDAIRQIQGQGTLVVVSAGNEGGPVDVPGNCPGVAAVAGIRQAGTKVGFSSLGPEVAVSAPAGNCVNTVTPFTPSAPCEYSIETTFDTGTTTPVAGNGYSYTDQLSHTNLGTSFSAPIVSGIAALMVSVNSNLSTCQLIARLKEGSTAFPQTSTSVNPVPQACHVPTGSTDVQNAECICTLDGKTCGAGMANAAGAVAAALRPIAVVTLPTSVAAGQGISLSAQGSVAATGHNIATYQWTNTGAQTATIQNGTTATPTVTAPSCGYSTLQVAVTDEVGREDTAEVVLSPTSATSVAPSTAVPGSCTTPTPAILLAVCPTTSSVTAGSGTQSFTATVANTKNDSVTWQVNGVVGGNATVGTISTTGVYTAPATVPVPSSVTVEAVSAEDQSVMSSTQVTITAPPKSSGGGAMDPFTLLVEGLALGAALVSRHYAASWRHARRCAASSQVF